jgi:hypothetical protein
VRPIGRCDNFVIARSCAWTSPLFAFYAVADELQWHLYGLIRTLAGEAINRTEIESEGMRILRNLIQRLFGRSALAQIGVATAPGATTITSMPNQPLNKKQERMGRILRNDWRIRLQEYNSRKQSKS